MGTWNQVENTLRKPFGPMFYSWCNCPLTCLENGHWEFSFSSVGKLSNKRYDAMYELHFSVSYLNRFYRIDRVRLSQGHMPLRFCCGPLDFAG